MTASIVFDLDGTLIDSAPDIHAGANTVLAEEGHDPLTMDEARSFIGNGAAVFVERMRAARGIEEGAQDRLLAAFLARYETFVGLTRPYPGVLDALRALQNDGHRLGLCTNKPGRPTHAVLAHLGLARFFDAVVAGDSLPVRKPDPAPLHAVGAQLGGGAMIYVGDSEVDAETAQRAGVTFLLFTEGYRKTPVADLPHTHAFDDFAALPALIGTVLSAS